MLVSIEAVQDAIEERGRIIGFKAAVECEKLWEEGEDECERDLFGSAGRHVLYSKSITRSRSREMKMTRRICFRLAGDTGVADIFIADG